MAGLACYRKDFFFRPRHERCVGHDLRKCAV